ncbi:guanitoxin biosynthesis heme-dependent pre-guanitoxin N-hydroxylase GntA [Zeaxanthinibacter sp. PT1]|uniref:guanitoxin biosynthesis heme-dependent pre-guanitoxin N-hydroxylase GntA n=1 Tax=Zeaxanthinibacter TaxID=561554 RepID=UPI00234B63CD|nr:guanitoxin biosynthesis heme-dependent pre-guanitoxin N-hydroxylase GntA [Zeaxanthinibacter sp. PT1]MDC6351488.1 guanitoxin biosynthesis heme-dependent pre-guanitoxin N-hydroxylase GntA [Zeaxanthinibacter sp. PT1]
MDKHIENHLRQEFHHFILDQDHPCIMARTMFKLDTFKLKAYPAMGSAQTTDKLLDDLENYLDNYDFSSTEFYSFIAAFPEMNIQTEVEYEQLLWKQLQQLHLKDDKDWDPDVSSDPDAPDFSFSLLGKAFYIVGMHPKSSRLARRSPVPCIVFNLHWQFEQLREMGTYQRIRDTIRERDKERNGSVNPMLSDFGTSSEARQYSGRQVPGAWQCPFYRKQLEAENE